MLADVHAKFGGRPPRSRRAARPPSWRRRRDRTPRIRAAHQSRSTTSEGLRGCPPDVGCTPDLIFPGARPSGAPVRTRHRTRRAASRDPTPFARWSGSIRIGTDWRMWPMPSPSAPAQGRDLRPTRRRSVPQPATARGVVRAWARTDGVPLSTEGTSLLRLRDRRVRRARRPARPAVVHLSVM